MSEDEKAICFCGKTSFSGLLLLEGTVAKEAGGDRFGCATMGGTGFRGAALNEPSAIPGRASSEFAGGSGFGAVGAAGFAVGATGFRGAALNEPSAVAGRASSEFAGDSGFGAVGAAGFAAGGAGFRGAAANELRAITGFLGLGLAGGGDAADAADFAESEVGFPGLLPFVPTGSAG
jgi:hypothetical protein